MIRRTITPKIKKVLFAKAANRCSFPGCNMELIDSEGNVIGEISHIEAIHPGGPRYNPEVSQNELFTEANFIVLCPTHHRLIDAQPFLYPVNWLREAKAAHEKAIEKAIAASDLEPISLDNIKTVSFTKALNIWSQNETNADEEFWQSFFRANPRIIAQAVRFIRIMQVSCKLITLFI